MLLVPSKNTCDHELLPFSSVSLPLLPVLLPWQQNNLVTPTFINELDPELPLTRACWLLDDPQRKQPLASSDLRWSQAIGPLVPIFTPTGTLGVAHRGKM